MFSLLVAYLCSEVSGWFFVVFLLSLPTDVAVIDILLDRLKN